VRIVFMGTSAFGLPTLDLLLKKEYPVEAVVTVPDKPAGRGRKLTESPVKQFAAGRGLPILQPSSMRDPWFAESLRALRPELIVVAAFRILPPSIFTIPSFGSINLHASLLPKYRGAAPINWAIIRGERETGVTTFFLEEEVDTGNILRQERIAIGPDETAGELHDRLAVAGAGVVLETVMAIGAKKAEPRKQDASAATSAPKIFTKDCRIDWTAGTRPVHDFIRGLSPKPGAFFRRPGGVMKVYRSAVVTTAEPTPAAGTVVEADRRLIVSCGDGAVMLTEIQQQGKKPMSAAEFLRGTPIVPGERFN
jgi:methionyl-tRNA formyltransferase